MDSFKIEQIDENKYRARIPHSFFESLGIPKETFYSPNKVSASIIEELGVQLADYLVYELEKKDEHYADMNIDFTGYVTSSEIIYTFELIDIDDEDDDYDELSVPVRAPEHSYGENKTYTAAIFDSMQECTDFYKKFLRDKENNVALIKYDGNYGLYIVDKTEKIQALEDKINEFMGEFIDVSYVYFLEHGGIIADKQTLEKISKA